MNWANGKRLLFVLALLVGLTPLLAGLAFAQTGPNVNLKRAIKFDQIDAQQNSTLSTIPALLGSYEIVGAGSAGNITIWDTIDGDPTHAQARVVAEAGVSGNLESFSSGTINRLTRYGLFVECNNVDAVIQWDD